MFTYVNNHQPEQHSVNADNIESTQYTVHTKTKDRTHSYGPLWA